MKRNFITKFALIFSMFIFMIVLVGCSSEDSSSQNSDHGTAEELTQDPGCAEPCHTADVLNS